MKNILLALGGLYALSKLGNSSNTLALPPAGGGPRVGSMGGGMDVNYLVEYMEKRVTEDDYEQGVIGATTIVETERNVNGGEAIPANDLIEDLGHRYGISTEPEPYTAFEDGRITYNQLEDEDGLFASDADVEKWKKGKKKLWLADYDFYVKRVSGVVTPTVETMIEDLSITPY